MSCDILHCPYCKLGVLEVYEVTDTEVDTLINKASCSKPPQHKRKRIRKKLIKKHKALIRMYKGAVKFIINFPPVFTCMSCKRRVGYYHALGSNMISVTRM